MQNKSHLCDLKHSENKTFFLVCFLVAGARFLKVPVLFGPEIKNLNQNKKRGS